MQNIVLHFFKKIYWTKLSCLSITLFTQYKYYTIWLENGGQIGWTLLSYLKVTSSIILNNLLIEFTIYDFPNII